MKKVTKQVVKSPAWKFMAIIAGNAKFKGCLGPNFCLIWVKNGKKLIIFNNFTLISQFESPKICNDIISAFLN